MIDNDINKIQQNIKELQDQNAIDFQQWKRLGQAIKKLDEKIKISNCNLNLLVKKIKADYESLRKIIIDENVQLQLNEKIENVIVDTNKKIDSVVTEIDSQLNNKVNNNKYLKYKITHDLPIHFSIYSDYLTLLDYSYIYPQGFYICEDKLYIIYQPDWTNEIKKSVVVVRNFINGDYITSFIVKGGFGESIVVKKEGGSLYLYTKSKNYHLGKYNITNVVEKQEVEPVEEFNVGLYSTFDYCQKTKQWYIEQASREVGLVYKRSLIEVYSENFTRIRQFTISPSISGMWNGDYVDYVSKKQGFAVSNGEIILGCGGLYRSTIDNEKPYNYQGIKTVLLNGELKSSNLIKPTTFINKLMEKDIIAERIENEGVTIYNGKKYVLYCTLGSTHQSLETGLLILEVDSNDCDLDFTNDYANEPVVNYNQINTSLFPRNGNKLINPFTGLEMNSLNEIYTLLTQSALSRITFYTTSVTITDINGVTLPQGYLAKVYNANNKTMIVELHGYELGNVIYNIYVSNGILKQKIVSGLEYDLSTLLIGGVATTQLKAKKEDSFVKICGVLTNIPQTEKPITLINNLPVELRPKYNTHHVVALSGSVNGGYGTITVLSEGKITFNYDSFGTSQYLTIDINYLL